MRALFMVDDAQAVEVVNALITHGGAEGVDHEVVSSEAVVLAAEDN